MAVDREIGDSMLLDVEWDVLPRRVAARSRVCERLTERVAIVDVELASRAVNVYGQQPRVLFLYLSC